MGSGRAEPVPGSSPSPDGLTVAAFVTMVLAAGGSPVAIRFTLEVGPYLGAAIRLLGGSLILFAVVGARRLPLPRGRALLGAALFGLLGGFGFYALVFVALRHVGAARATPVMAAVPLLTLLFAAAHRVEPFRLRGLAGGLLSLSGIAMLSRSSHAPSGSWIYLAFVLAAAALAAEAGVLLKKFPPVHPITLNAIATGLGGTLLLLLSYVTKEPHGLPHHARTWFALGYLVVMGSALMFVCYVTVIERWTVTGASYQFVLFPIVTVILAGVVAHEPISASLAAGGALVLAGVHVGALSGHRTRLHRLGHRTAVLPEPCAPS